MPVRRRKDKRLSTDGLASWESVFSTGFDFFDDLEDVGVDTDEYGRPSVEDAKAAWLRLGEAFRYNHDPQLGEPWALREFGPPAVRGRRRRR